MKVVEYYQVLGVDRDASANEILAAYRQQLQRWHPDHNDSPEAHTRTILIVEAWEILGDPAKRKQYDDQLFTGHRVVIPQAAESARPKPTSSDLVMLCKWLLALSVLVLLLLMVLMEITDGLGWSPSLPRVLRVVLFVALLCAVSLWCRLTASWWMTPEVEAQAPMVLLLPFWILCAIGEATIYVTAHGFCFFLRGPRRKRKHP
jgi:hypothetical protein